MPKSALRDRAALVLVAVVAVMIFVLAASEPPSFVAGLMFVTPEALAITWAVTWRTRWPRVGRVLAITSAPRRAVGPTVGAVMWIVDVPWRCRGERVLRRAPLLEEVLDRLRSMRLRLPSRARGRDPKYKADAVAALEQIMTIKKDLLSVVQ